MVSSGLSGKVARPVPGSGESGQSSVEWVGLVLLLSGAFASLSLIGPTVSPSAFVHSIHRAILCAAAFGDRCPGGPPIDHYGAEVAALVRRYEPEIAFGPDLLGMPVDFRTCRSPGCAEPQTGRRLAGSTADERLTIFTRVIDCRGGRKGEFGGPGCRSSAEGNLYIQFWAYFPESATLRGVPVLERRGWHRHDWESTQVRIGRDGSVSQRASSHSGHNHTRSLANWPSDAGIELPSRMDRLLGRRSAGGWGPWTGRWLIAGGSHAGNVADEGEPDSYPVVSRRGTANLVPLEAVRGDALVRPARFDPISPPWEKHLWSDPEAIGTG